MGDRVFLMNMGERISIRRKELRMTQEELAEKIDVSIPMISNLEQGKKAIRPENLVKVCAALGLSADYILTGRRTTQRDVIAFLRGVETLNQEELQLVNNLIQYLRSKK